MAVNASSDTQSRISLIYMLLTQVLIPTAFPSQIIIYVEFKIFFWQTEKIWKMEAMRWDEKKA